MSTHSIDADVRQPNRTAGIRRRPALRTTFVATLLSVAACGGSPEDPGVVDSRPTECTPDATVCDPALNLYTACSSTGTIATQLQCPLGCDVAAAKCIDMDPSNGLAAALDMLPTYPGVRNITIGDSQHTYYMDTDSGVVQAPARVDIPSVIINGMRVFLFDQLRIRGGVLRITGGRPVAFVAKSFITIESSSADPDFGLIDVSATMAARGPGSRNDCSGGTGAGEVGGGGGGGFDVGGVGGASFGGTPGAPGGIAVRGDELIPLRGGCRGGGAAASSNAAGGGGGGAIQIVSRIEIRFTRAGVDASGGGGYTGMLLPQSPNYPGTGGGGGGSILLEAPEIVLEGGAILSTKGGSGAAASVSGAGLGSDGGIGAIPPGCGSARCGGCGRGGTELTLPAPGGRGPTATCPLGGGGGGAVGQTRINTASGRLTGAGAYVMRTRFSFGTLSTRLVP